MRSLLANLLLALGSLAFLFCVLLLGEGLVRAFSDVPLLGNSANLFAAEAWGTSRGNAPNVEAVSFGAAVFTDADGFRVPEGRTAAPQGEFAQSILVLGDSVAFGPGVAAEQTFAELLAQRHPGLHVRNASVIGYAAADYENVARHFVLERAGVDRVVVAFCLNDVSDASAAAIEEALAKPANLDAVERLRALRPISALNDFLRSRSKAYLLVKGILTDPQARYWEAEFRLYRDSGDAALASLEPIVRMARALEQRGIALLVAVLPYEYQLRAADPALRLPQRLLAGFFESHGIDHVDALPYFERRGGDSRELFLRFDPMHLSVEGHEIVYEVVRDAWGLAQVR